jgi:hypothetical protein
MTNVVKSKVVVENNTRQTMEGRQLSLNEIQFLTNPPKALSNCIQMSDYRLYGSLGS